MKKADIILFAVFLLIGIIGITIYFITGKNAEYISVSVDGETIGVYSLYEDCEIPIRSGNGENVLLIQNSTARMISADCPNQDCVLHKEISQSNESIVCLPHKVVVTVIKEPVEGDLDAVTY